MTKATSTIKTAIVGYGLSAKTFHIPFITANADYELVAISSSQKDAIEADLPGMAVFKSAEVMIEQAGADLIIITAPNDVHYSLTKCALLNDTHVLVEKPFVTNFEDGAELIELAEARGKKLAVYHNRRFDGDFLTIKKLVDEGTLGTTRYFESHFDRFRPDVQNRWRETATDGSGILYDLGPHLIDQALMLFGRPKAISASVKAIRQGSQATDLAHIVLEYESMLAVLHMTLFSAGPNRRFQLQGDLGSYEKYGLDPQEDCLKASASPAAEGWAAEDPSDYGTLYRADSSETFPTVTGGYEQYFAGLAAAIKTDAPLPVAPEDALLTIKLIELAIKSSETGKSIRL